MPCHPATIIQSARTVAQSPSLKALITAVVALGIRISWLSVRILLTGIVARTVEPSLSWLVLTIIGTVHAELRNILRDPLLVAIIIQRRASTVA